MTDSILGRSLSSFTAALYRMTTGRGMAIHYTNTGERKREKVSLGDWSIAWSWSGCQVGHVGDSDGCTTERVANREEKKRKGEM